MRDLSDFSLCVTDNGGLDAGEKAVEACATYMREKDLLPQYASDLRMYLAGMLSCVPNPEHTVDHVCERGVYRVYALSRFYDAFQACFWFKRESMSTHKVGLHVKAYLTQLTDETDCFLLMHDFFSQGWSRLSFQRVCMYWEIAQAPMRCVHIWRRISKTVIGSRERRALRRRAHRSSRYSF